MPPRPLAPMLLVGDHPLAKGRTTMTVQQLIQALSLLPPDATVLLEGDEGYSPLGHVDVVANGGGLPDEVLLQPDMTPD